MTYTKEEKNKIDALLDKFQDYIGGHKYFDVAYSKKTGYILLDLNEDGAILDDTVIHNSEELLTLLFDEVADDVRDERISNGDDTPCLYHCEIAALRTILNPILNKLAAGKEYCLNALDEYIAQRNTN